MIRLRVTDAREKIFILIRKSINFSPSIEHMRPLWISMTLNG
jgi:hypothetical protein